MSIEEACMLLYIISNKRNLDVTVLLIKGSMNNLTNLANLGKIVQVQNLINLNSFGPLYTTIHISVIVE